MLFWIIVKVALKSLLANKLRTFLAMLGIIIGVGAVISMLALGMGAQTRVLDRITAMGTDLLIVRPGGERRGGVMTGSRQSLKLGDAAAILEQVDGVEAVAPQVSGQVQVNYFGRNMSTNLTGISDSYLDIRSFTVEKGRRFTAVEEENLAQVALLGPAVVEELFGAQEPLGETVRVKNVNFRVIGVLKAKGDQGFFNVDEMVLVPYTTAMRLVLGRNYLGEVDVKARVGADLTRIAGEIGKLLRRRHHLGEEAEDDFQVRNQAEIIEIASSFTQTFTILLGGIAGISLLVGGIGIMNIMLVTVTERTREIGLRKAIGARNRDILGQFLLESILISGLGGLFGLSLGLAGASAFDRFTDFRTVVDVRSIFLALGVAGAIGVFFGWYPARRAASLDPIEALRHE